MSNKRSCPYKTLNGLDQLSGTSLLLDNITIQGPSTYPTYTLTLPLNDGLPGQILSTDGTGVLSWVNDSGSTGTVTSVSATVPAWLSVTVTNPTTTPAITITGTSTGTGTVTVLQDSPTLNNVVTITDQLHMTRNSGTGHAIKITNAHAGIQDNYIEIGKNSSAGNHAHYGHYYVNNNDPLNYAFIYTDSYFVKFFGGTDFTFPKIAPTGIDELLVGNAAGEATWTTTLAAPGGYTFNSPVYLNSTFVVSSLQVNGSFSVIQNVASGIMGTFTNDTANTLVHNYVQIGSSNSSAMNRARFGHYFAGINNSANYAFIQTNGRRLMFAGSANFTTPITEGTVGQALITDGTGVSSWADRVSSVSATVPSFMSVTVTNATTTPAIAISATSTGTGAVVLKDSPVLTGNTTIASRFTTGITSAKIQAGLPSAPGNPGGEAVLYMDFTDPNTGVIATTNITAKHSASYTTHLRMNADGIVFNKGVCEGKMSINTTGYSPSQSLYVVGDIKATTTIDVANTKLTSSAGSALNLILPNATGTSGQVLTSTGSGTAMTWTTPTTGTVTSVAATSPLASSGGATPTISIASSTGTGSVVLNTDPELQTTFNVKAPVAGEGYLRFVSVSNTNYIQTALSNVSGSIADLVIGSHTNISQLMILKASGDVGIGTTTPSAKLSVIGSGGFYNPLNVGINFSNAAPQSFTIGVRGDTSNVFAITDDTATAFRMVIDTTGNVGIGTATPTRKLTVSDDNTSVIRFERTGAARFDAEIGLFTNGDFQIRGGADGSTLTEFLRILGVNGNVGINTATPIAKLHVNAPGGQQLYIQASDQYAFMAFAPYNVRKCYFGFPYGGGATKDLVLVNEYSDGGDIQLDCVWANARIRCIKPILLQEAVTLQRNPSSSTFTFVFPSSMGTSGQVLTTDGTNTYWGSGGGGGGGGTVNSVTASAPLASSGGTAPDISIASATGTGAVVLASAPTFTSQFFVDAGGGAGYMKITSTGNTNYIQSGLTSAGDSSAPLLFTSINAGSEWMRITSTGVGIGGVSPTAKLHIVDSSVADTSIIANSNNASYASLKFSTPTRDFVIGAGGSTATAFSGTLQNKAYFIFNSSIAGIIDSSQNWGIGTTSPTTKLHVNGAFRVQGGAITQNGGESQFSNGSFSDPDSGQAYNAKFGNTDPNSNGIAVKGNSRFTGSVFANNFTTNLTDYFTYYESTDPSLCTMQGSNLAGGTFGIDCIDSAFIFVTNTQVSVTRIGKIVTVSFLIEFSYNSNPTPGFTKMAIVLKYPSIRTPANVTNMYAQGICNWPTNISGVGNPLSVTAYNCTAQGVAAVALLVTGSAGLVDYNTSFAQSNQRLTGSITYVIR